MLSPVTWPCSLQQCSSMLQPAASDAWLGWGLADDLDVALRLAGGEDRADSLLTGLGQLGKQVR